MTDLFKQKAIEAAEHFKLDQKLVLAMVQVESAWDTFAVRYEPDWHYFATPKDYALHCHITDSTEMILQKCSFGLMQVMGATARSLGFKENLLRLTDPALGLYYGCKKLDELFKKHDLKTDIIAAYNAGIPVLNALGKYKNQSYVDKVLKAMGVA